jgi:hypothetical protein
MLRFSWMAMQQSGKGAGDSDAASRAASALSDEQADEFAASFTPSWDTGEDSSGPANVTLVDAPAMGAAEAAAVVQAAPQVAAPAFHPKQTLIGTAPQANAPATSATSATSATHASPAARRPASSAEAIDPENILDSSTAPQPEVRAAAPAPPAAAPQTSLKGTQIMASSPAQMDARKAQSRPPPPGPAASAAKNAAVGVTADPFAASARSGPGPARRAHPQSEDLDDFVPKKSSKTLYLVLAGLVFAGGLGLFLRFALSEDPKPGPVQEHATGPAVATAEIPPPPPKVDTPPTPAAATAATAPKVEAQAPPAPLAAPQSAPQPVRPAEPPAHVAAAPPQQPRQRVTPPQPQAVSAPPTPPASPKTAPKPSNGSIVRDNPF